MKMKVLTWAEDVLPEQWINYSIPLDPFVSLWYFTRAFI